MLGPFRRAGSVWGCRCRGGLSTPGRRGPSVETTCWSVGGCCVSWGLPPPPASGRVERNGSAVETPLWVGWSRSGVLGPFGRAGAVEVSPRRAAGALRSRRRVGLWGMLCFMGPASPARFWSCRAVRSVVETTRGSKGNASPGRYRSCRAERCDRRERVLSGCGVQSRHPLGRAGVVQGCWVRLGMPVPWRSLHVGPRGPFGRDDVLVCGACCVL